MKRFIPALALFACLTTCAAAWADRAPPPNTPPAGIKAPLTLKEEKNAPQYRLLIPKKFLADVKLGQLEDGDTNLTGDRGRTVLAGLAFSLAIGSVVVFRRRGLTAALLVGFGVVALGAGAIGWADIAPNPPPKDAIVIEILEKGDTVTLIIPSPAK